MLADILTKPLAREKFEKLREKMGKVLSIVVVYEQYLYYNKKNIEEMRSGDMLGIGTGKVDGKEDMDII